MLLQKWQRNQLFDGLKSVGLSPDDFDYEDNGTEAVLKHKWSTSYFLIGGGSGNYVGRRVVGDGPVWPVDAHLWSTVVDRSFGLWLNDLKRDIDMPDLWVELKRDTQLLGGVSGDANENTLFTPEERKHIEQRLRELETHMSATYSLSESEIRMLRAKIDYLVDAAGRLGRKDWVLTCAGVVLGYILVAALSPESARAFMEHFLHFIRQLLEHELPGLPIG